MPRDVSKRNHGLIKMSDFSSNRKSRVGTSKAGQPKRTPTPGAFGKKSK